MGLCPPSRGYSLWSGSFNLFVHPLLFILHLFEDKLNCARLLLFCCIISKHYIFGYSDTRNCVCGTEY